MKTILHIAKKDLIGMRWAWTLWTGLLILEIVVGELMLSHSSLNKEVFLRLRSLESVFTPVHAACCFVLVAFLVLEDSPVGSRIFWPTRPISGGTLLFSKLVTVFLVFWIWPVVVGLPWWIYCGLSGRVLFDAAIRIGFVNGMVIVPTMALAVLAKNFSRLLSVAFIAGAAMIALLSILFARKVSGGSSDLLYTLNSDIPLVIGLFTSAVVVLIQYLQRRGVLAKIVLFSGLSLAVSIIVIKPWVPPTLEQTGDLVAGTERVELKLNSMTLSERADKKGHLNVNCVLQNLPAELTRLSSAITLHFEWSDGTHFEYSDKKPSPIYQEPPRYLFNLGSYQRDPETEQKFADIRKEREGRLPLEATDTDTKKAPKYKGRSVRAAIELPEDIAKKLIAEPPVCTLSFSVAMGQPIKVLQLPLGEGNKKRENGVRFRVSDLKKMPKDSEHSDQRFVGTAVYSMPLNRSSLQLYRVDEQRGVMVPINVPTVNSIFLAVLPMALTHAHIEIQIPQLWRKNQWVDDPDQVLASSLGVTETLPAGQLVRELKIDQLHIDEYSHLPDGKTQ